MTNEDVLPGKNASILPKDEHGKLKKTYVRESDEGMLPEKGDLHDRSGDLLKLVENRTKLGLFFHPEAMPEAVVTFFSQVQAAGGVVIVAKLDINDLKKVNDTFGHELADELMMKLFQEKIQAFRKADIFEFFIWQPHAGGDEARLVIGLKPSEKVREKSQSASVRTAFTGEKAEQKQVQLKVERLVQMVEAALKQVVVVEKPNETDDPQHEAEYVAEIGEPFPEEKRAQVHAEEVGSMSLGYGVVLHEFGGDQLDEHQLKKLGEELFKQAEERLEKRKNEKPLALINQMRDLLAEEGMTAKIFKERSLSMLDGGRNNSTLIRARDEFIEVLLRQEWEREKAGE